MKKLFKKSLSVLLTGLFVLGVVSCEDPLSFDIRDYTFTLSIQDGYRDGDVLIYPELAASVEGPGVNLWDITVQSEDGESITFQALTGATEYMELPFKAFKEEKSTLSISVTARESAHQEFLGEETLTARVNLLVR